jgi:hypothetical protein
MSISHQSDALLAIHPQGDVVSGIIITANSSDFVDNHGLPYDFVSRYFAVWSGVPEDPATGTEAPTDGRCSLFQARPIAVLVHFGQSCWANKHFEVNFSSSNSDSR